MTYGANAYKGIFIPKNPGKYQGDPNNIVFRSSWERRVYAWLDRTENVLSWSSEETPLPYISPVDNKKHRYFPDCTATIKDQNGNVTTYMIEIKPEKFTHPPEPQKKKTVRYINEVKQWGVNTAKWNSAINYCNEKGWTFMLLTEKNIPKVN